MAIADKSAEMSWFNFVLFGRRTSERREIETIRDWFFRFLHFSPSFFPASSGFDSRIGFYFNTHFTSPDVKLKCNESINIFINSSNRSTTRYLRNQISMGPRCDVCWLLILIYDHFIFCVSFLHQSGNIVPRFLSPTFLISFSIKLENDLKINGLLLKNSFSTLSGAQPLLLLPFSANSWTFYEPRNRSNETLENRLIMHSKRDLQPEQAPF